MKQLFFLSLLIFFQYLTAQKRLSPVDSIQNLIKKTDSETEKIKLLDSLNTFYINTSPQKLTENNLKIIELAKKINLPKAMSKAYRFIAEAGLRTHNFEQAKQNAEKALKIDDSLHNYVDVIIDYNQLGRAYYNFNQPKKAIEIYKKAIALYQKHPVGKKIGVIYGNIGAAYNSLNRSFDALKYFLKQADFADKNGQVVQKSKVNYNIGYTYMQLNQFQKSEKYFQKALQDSAKIEVKDYVYVNFHALGMLYSRWGKYDKALKANRTALGYFDKTQNKMYQFDLHNNNATIYLKKDDEQRAIEEAKKALAIADSIGFKLGSDAAQTTLADIYLHFGKYKKAAHLLNKLKKDKTIHHHEIRQTLYDDLYRLGKHNNNYKEALSYLEKAKKLSDSLLKSQRDSKIAEIETRYQTEKKEIENLKLKADKARQQLLLEKENKRNTFLTAGFAGAMFFLGIFGFYYRRNKRQKEMIEHLQKDLHHRVKNNLAIIDALIEDIKDDFEDHKIQIRLEELQNRISSISEIHRQLYQNKDITRLNFKNYVDKISHSVQETYGNQNIKIYNFITENIKLPVKQTFPIGLIINEFVANSFKYAFEKGQSGKIEIDLKDLSGHYLLKLKDNGKGLPEDLNLNDLESFGLSIMQLLAKQLKGKFKIVGNQGVEVEIEFPKN